MTNNKLALNIALVFLSVGVVLMIRMETAFTSYEIAKSHRSYKQYETSSKTLSAHYQKKIGSERMVSEASDMLAMEAPQSHQVVMVLSLIHI